MSVGHKAGSEVCFRQRKWSVNMDPTPLWVYLAEQRDTDGARIVLPVRQGGD